MAKRAATTNKSKKTAAVAVKTSKESGYLNPRLKPSPGWKKEFERNLILVGYSPEEAREMVEIADS